MAKGNQVKKERKGKEKTAKGNRKQKGKGDKKFEKLKSDERI